MAFLLQEYEPQVAAEILKNCFFLIEREIAVKHPWSSKIKFWRVKVNKITLAIWPEESKARQLEGTK